MPALLWAGLSPVQALGTTKLQGTCGTFSAAYNYLRKGQAELASMTGIIVLTLAGGALGAVAVHWVSPSFLRNLIPFLLIIIAVYFLLCPRLGQVEGRRRLGSGPLP